MRCRLPISLWLVSALVGAWVLSSPAVAESELTGTWTLSQDNTTRECRLQLRREPLGTGQAVAMPPGCRRAFPVLNGVRSWVMVDASHMTLNNDADAALLLFEDDGNGRFQAIGPEGSDRYTLTATGPRPRVNDDQPEATEAAAASVVRQPENAVDITTPAAVAGHYAVLRGTRDTGCMVTLDEPTRSSGTPLKARLAPACRDQGIIVFDPVGWQLKSGRLVLTARKGHTAELQRDESGLWVKDGKSAQPLGLKRL